jgi:hypothetical protein
MMSIRADTLTPGPWVATPNGRQTEFTITHPVPEVPGLHVVVGSAVIEPDAKLIAQAPHMADALRAIATFQPKPDTDFRELHAIWAAMARITLEGI